MVAEVVLRESVWNTNKAYDYLVPEELSEKIKVGQYIRVPFGNGNRPCVALVMKLKEEAQVKEGARAFRMKSIHSIVEEEPVLNQEQLEILHFLTKRYASTYGSAMHQMVPALVTKRTGRSQLVVSLVSEEKARDAIDSESISSLPQLRALQWLLEVEEMPLSDLMQELSISRSPIDTLAKNGLVTIRSVHFSAEQQFVPEYIDHIRILAHLFGEGFGGIDYEEIRVEVLGQYHYRFAFACLTVEFYDGVTGLG